MLKQLCTLAKTDIQAIQNNVQTIQQTIVKTQEFCSSLINKNTKGIYNLSYYVILTKIAIQTFETQITKYSLWIQEHFSKWNDLCIEIGKL